MSRPTVQTDATEKKILAALKIGNTRTNSALLAGISYDTFKTMLESREGFADRVSQAEAEAQNLFVAVIHKAARPHKVTVEKVIENVDPETGITLVKREVTTKVEFDWRAADKILSKRWREDWADKVEIDVRNLTEEQLIALLEKEAGGGSEEEGDSDPGDEDGDEAALEA